MKRCYLLQTCLLPAQSTHLLAGHAGHRIDRDVRIDLAAQARVHLAAVAVERTRLVMGVWPKTLADIPASIMDSVPLDPFTGRRFAYEPHREGVVLDSAGPCHDATADNATIRFRLYHPEPGQRPPSIMEIAPLPRIVGGAP